MGKEIDIILDDQIKETRDALYDTFLSIVRGSEELDDNIIDRMDLFASAIRSLDKVREVL